MPAERPSWISGVGGLTSTLGNYGRFAAMLANGGELGGARILGPKIVSLYSLNHTPAEALPYGFQANDLYHAGYGCSLGTRVLMTQHSPNAYYPLHQQFKQLTYQALVA